MKNYQENKVMDTENIKDVEVDLEQIGDKVVGGANLARDLKWHNFLDRFKLATGTLTPEGKVKPIPRIYK